MLTRHSTTILTFLCLIASDSTQCRRAPLVVNMFDVDQEVDFDIDMILNEGGDTTDELDDDEVHV